jgi:phosphoribosylformylglycinamidine cyclo-ligase
VTHVTEGPGLPPGGMGILGDQVGLAREPAGYLPWMASNGRGGRSGRGGRKRTVTYADAGVSIHAGEQAVERLKSQVHRTRRPEVLGQLGGFAGLFRLDTSKYRSPVLASSTDGVGTKLLIAQAMGVHDTVGLDLVAMVVDDIVACGAEPLFLLDYVACGEVQPDRVAEIGSGVAHGCQLAGCALIGGETAEHPGVLAPHEYDLAATGVGVVEEDEILGRERVQVGDVVIAMGSSGLHANGFSLVRHVLLGAGRLRLDSVVDDLGEQRTVGEELLTPTKIYTKDCLGLRAESEVHAFAHVTGGGIPGNLVRVLPSKVDAVVNRSSWCPQPIFNLVQRRGRIDDAEMEATFNMGIGMLAIVAADDADRALAFLRGRRIDAWQAGEIVEGSGSVQMLGSFAGG